MKMQRLITDSFHQGIKIHTGNRLRVALFLLATVPLITLLATTSADAEYTQTDSWGGSGSSNGQFNFPQAVATSSDGYVYVADSDNKRIQKFDSNGLFVKAWDGSGTAAGKLQDASGVTVDNNGNVYVTDSYSNRIVTFDADGQYVSHFGATGSGNGELDGPKGIATDVEGNIYVTETDNNRVQKFDKYWNYLAKWDGSGTAGGVLDNPSDLAVSSDGFVYVTDRNNNQIQKFNIYGTFAKAWGTQGSGPSQFSKPYGVEIDSGGSVYVTDSLNNRVQVFDKQGVYIDQWSTEFSLPMPQVLAPTGISIDGDGYIYLSTVNDWMLKYGDSPSTVELPDISGKTNESEILSATQGSWKAIPVVTSYTYRWMRCDTDGSSCSIIPGAVYSTYELTASDVGNTIRVEVTASNGVGTLGKAESNATVVIASKTAPPAVITLPKISGSTQVGSLLSASPGSWSGVPEVTKFSYSWERCNAQGNDCVKIPGANDESYLLTEWSIGFTVRVKVTADNGVGAPVSAFSDTTTVIEPKEVQTPDPGLVQNNVAQGAEQQVQQSQPVANVGAVAPKAAVASCVSLVRKLKQLEKRLKKIKRLPKKAKSIKQLTKKQKKTRKKRISSLIKQISKQNKKLSKNGCKQKRKKSKKKSKKKS